MIGKKILLETPYWCVFQYEDKIDNTVHVYVKPHKDKPTCCELEIKRQNQAMWYTIKAFVDAYGYTLYKTST